MSIISADPENLAAYTSTAAAMRWRFEPWVESAAAQQGAVIAASESYGQVVTNTTAVAAQLVAMVGANELFVSTIRDALLAADGYDGSGSASVMTASLDAALDAAGVGAAPELVDEITLEVIGFAQTSGFVDDPVDAFNGNFVHGDADLDLPGRAGVLSIVRVHNSLADGIDGVFGPGWTCQVDMGVDVADPGRPVVRLADGAHVVFLPTQVQGVFAGRVRSGLRLTRREDGWELAESPQLVWHFDAEGRWVGGTGVDHEVAVTRADDTLTVAEVRSGRWVRYALADGRVTAVTSSDGRVCTYDYDDSGRLIAAGRPIGGVGYELDEAGLIGRIVDADGVVVVANSYDTAGRVTVQVSRHGRTTDYAYGDGNVTVVADRDPDGPRNVLIHDDRGNLLAMFDGEGAVARMAYDGANRRTVLTDREGHTTRYCHDDWGRLVGRSDPDGLTCTWTFDHLGRLVAEVDRAGARTEHTYEGSSPVASQITTSTGTMTVAVVDDRPVRVSDADSITTRSVWNADGLLTERVDGMGGVTRIDYDAAGRTRQVTDPAGRIVRYQADLSGRVVASHTPDGTETFEWTAAGRCTRAVQADGSAVGVTYGTAGDPVELVDAAGGVVRLTHDRSGNLTTVTAADGQTFAQEHDAVGRVIATVGPTGARSELAYDREGRTIGVTAADGRRWRRTVDAFGRSERVEGPEHVVQERTYHPGGQLATATDARGGTVMTEVDAAGRVVAVTDQLGGVTRYDWSVAGRLIAVTSPEGRTRRLWYDAAGNLLVEVDPEGVRTTYGRDADGQVEQIRTDEQETVLRYDQAGRLAGITGDGQPEQAIEHDLAGPASIDVGGVVQRYGWDPRGLLAQATDPAGVVTAMEYDVRGRLVAARTGSQATTVDYGLAGWARSVTDPLGHTTLLTHDPAGRLTAVTRPDGSGLTYGYDASGNLAQIRSLAGDVLQQIGRDADGEVGEVATADGADVVALQRDAVGRLVARAGSTGTARYAWDLDGLLVDRTDVGGSVVSVQRSEGGRVTGYLLDGIDVGLPDLDDRRLRDEAGRISADEVGRVYAYDTAGRLAGVTLPDGRTTRYRYDRQGLLSAEDSPEGTIVYTHDAAGRLVAVQREDGTTEALAYDGAGRRTGRRCSDGSAVVYTYDDLDRLVRFDVGDAGGTTQTVRIGYDPLGRPVRIEGIGDEAVQVDHEDVGFGKPVRIGAMALARHGAATASAGQGGWSEGRGDDPWGEDGRRDVRIGMRGELAVDHLMLMGARTYDPTTRQFLTPDPLPPVPGRPCYASPYAYAWNDPVNWLDPTGMRPLSDEQFNALRDHSERNNFQHSWDTMAADPWGTLAMVGIVAVGVGLMFVPGGQVVGAGILIGAGASAAIGVATDTFSPRTVAVTGGASGFAAFAAAPFVASMSQPVMLGQAGVSQWAAPAAVLAVEATTNYAEYTVDQVVTHGRGLNDIGVTEGLLAAGMFLPFGRYGGPTTGGLASPSSAILPKPSVSSTRLSNIVDDLYKGTTNPNRVGTGTTADAVRNELATGLPTGGTFHTQKAEQYSNALRRLLRQDLSHHDRLVAQSLLDDLQRALQGQP